MKLKKYYDKLKIKEKLTMAHLLIVLLVSFVSLISFQVSFNAVSYTHLTLPTNREV